MAYTSNPQAISDLLVTPDIDDVRAFLLAYLSVAQNPINDWSSGAVLRTMFELESLIISDLAGGSLPSLVANGYPDTATGSSLTKIARGWYGIDRVLPTVAVQTVNLFCDASHGPYSAAQVATLVGLSTDGASYAITTGGSIATSGGLAVTFTALTPGRATGLIASFQNPLAGVTVTSASITGPGSDGDSDFTVEAAMDARFVDLAAIPTQDRLIVWAQAAAPAPALTRFRIDADPAYPGAALVTLANATGTVGSTVVNAVQAAFDLLSPITDINTAQDSTVASITARGTVTLKSQLIPAAKTAANAAWSAYLSTAQIGAKVYLEMLDKIIGDVIKGDPGSNFTGQSLDGSSGDGNVALTATQVPVPATVLDTPYVTWVPT